jgi:putative tricarboxylic transport membrane protein
VPEAAVQAWARAFREAAASPGYAALREQHGLYPFALTGPALDDYVQVQIKAYRRLAEELGLRRWPAS